MNLKRIRKIRKFLTLGIILATGLRRYFKYKEKKVRNQEQGVDKDN